MYISVEENIRIEFDRFFEAVKLHNHEINDQVRDMLTILEENIIQEYNGQSDEIFNEGYDEGRDHGFESGYEVGHSDGREIGQDEGFSEGLAEALENCNCKEED
jgi:flagellar biosynthesis/type III secretory pathway protein FliH